MPSVWEALLAHKLGWMNNNSDIPLNEHWHIFFPSDLLGKPFVTPRRTKASTFRLFHQTLSEREAAKSNQLGDSGLAL